MDNLLSKVSGALAASARRVSRATRRLLRSRSIRKGKKEAKTAAASGADGEAVWHRSILMGQRCEPLNFSGAIHYDGQGRRLSQPRGGRASAKLQLQAATMLICRSAGVVDEAAITASKQRSAAINGRAALELADAACDDPSTAGAGGRVSKGETSEEELKKMKAGVVLDLGMHDYSANFAP